jgi:hypothetical protein
LFDGFFESREEFVHTYHVTTEIVDKDIVSLTLMAYISEFILGTSEDVNIALTIIEMIVGYTFLT